MKIKKKNDRTVEIEVDLPEDLIKEVEELCKKRSITFNDFAAEAVQKFIEKHKRVECMNAEELGEGLTGILFINNCSLNKRENELIVEVMERLEELEELNCMLSEIKKKLPY